jgi:alkylated DNA repair dioxygenase AlkB
MLQLPLVPEKAPVPRVEGLRYLERYIDSNAEGALLTAIDREEWRRDYKRRTQYFGLSYDDAAVRGALRWLRDIPPWLLPFGQRLVADRILPRAPENVVINEYLPGQGIAQHIDRAPFGPTVAILSLASPIVLDLHDPELDEDASIDLAPRSLLVLGGEARSRWMHGIAPRKSDSGPLGKRLRSRRVSITFRTAKNA